MKYAIEVVNHIIVAIHSFDDDTPIPQHLVQIENVDDYMLGQSL